MSAWLLSYMLYDETLGIHETCQLLALIVSAVACFSSTAIIADQVFGSWKKLKTKADAGYFTIEIATDFICNEGAYGCCFTGSYPWEFIPTLG